MALRSSKMIQVQPPDEANSESVLMKPTSLKGNSSRNNKMKSSLDISFHDLSYTVKTGLNPFRREPKKLLNSIGGEFVSGQVTAILGPSGAGKTSLLNILSGFRTEGVTGSILVNKKERNATHFAMQSCYIMQDNHLQPLLTVGESMTFAATLKLGRKFSPNKKSKRVNLGYVYERLNILTSDSGESDEEISSRPGPKSLKAVVESVLESMSLSSHRNTLAGALSGGERKKLSIALELINNPPIMFFDEPTSGLDSSSAKQCLSVLKLLSAGGRTIVCTLHQPSAAHLNLIDNLYFIAKGECIYHGSPANLIPYLSSIGLKCPAYHNPADFMIEIACGEWGDHTDVLVSHTFNGNNLDWKKTERNESIDITDGSNVTLSSNDFCESDYDLRLSYRPSILTQFRILLWRDCIKIYRDSFLTKTRLSLHFLVALLLGIFYYDIGRDAAHTLDNFSLLFFSVLFLMFTALSSKLITFPDEIPIVSREHFNGWYSLKAYFISNSISDAPTQVLSVLAYSVTVYVMSSQPPELSRFLLFFLMLSTVTLLTQAVGVLVGILLDVKNGVIFGPLTCLPWVIFSGFFLRAKDTPPYFRWVFDISFMKYALEGVMTAIYGNNRPVLDCSEMYCHFRMPKKLLHDLGLKDGLYWHDYSFILVLFVGVKLGTYFVLCFQTSRKM